MFVCKIIRLNIDIEGLDLQKNFCISVTTSNQLFEGRIHTYPLGSTSRYDPERIYDKVTADNKFFINKKFIPDAESIGFKIEQRTGMTADSLGSEEISFNRRYCPYH